MYKRQVLLPDEALLGFFVGQERSFVWAISQTGAPDFAAIDLGADDLGEQVDEIRLALAPDAASLGDIPSFDLAVAYELYEQLLGPVVSAWWLQKHLVIVPHRALGYLPLSVLPTKEIEPVVTNETLFSEYRDVPWLARTHSVTVLPSVGALRTLRAMPSGKGTRRNFAGFADPVFSSEQAQVVAFTATQIPNIDDRRYPAVLAGSQYPDGLGIHPEEDLPTLITDLALDEVVFAAHSPGDPCGQGEARLCRACQHLTLAQVASAGPTKAGTMVAATAGRAPGALA